MTNRIGMDLARLNSLTKYPSILTYHKIGDKGQLQQDLTSPIPDSSLICSEKIDGTNTRIILMPGAGAFIGSREELLTYSDDLVHNPALQIVETVRQVMNNQLQRYRETLYSDSVLVIYGECYGGKITAASKQYTSDPTLRGFRAFDIKHIRQDELQRAITLPVEQIALEREALQSGFLDYNTFTSYCTENALSYIKNLLTITSQELPVQIADTYEWLKAHAKNTVFAIDGNAGKAEGIVIKSPDRSFIRKLRFDDYERTLKQRKTS